MGGILCSFVGDFEREIFLSYLIYPSTFFFQEMSAVERETRLEAIMPNTTSLCEQIALKLGKVKELLDGVEEEQQGIADDIEMRIESDVFVLQQVFSGPVMSFV